MRQGGLLVLVGITSLLCAVVCDTKVAPAFHWRSSRGASVADGASFLL